MFLSGPMTRKCWNVFCVGSCHSDMVRGGSRKNFDILKIATPQAAPKDHTQKLQLCYERTIEGYYFLWHFN